MSHDESRRQFEDWFMTTFGVDKYWLEDRRCEPESYTLGEKVLIYWECWKASRQAIEIDLPKACAGDEYFIDGVFQPMRYERDVERALSAAGLKIKGEP